MVLFGQTRWRSERSSGARARLHAAATAAAHRRPLRVVAAVLLTYAALGHVHAALARRTVAEALGLAMVWLGLDAQRLHAPRPGDARESLRLAVAVAAVVLPVWLCLRTWALPTAPLRLPEVDGSTAQAALSLLWHHGLAVALPEELFWRGFVQGNLQRLWSQTQRTQQAPWASRRALLLASSGFALSHVVGGASPLRLATLLPGLLFGWIFGCTGSVWGPWLLHVACNLVAAAADGLAPVVGPPDFLPGLARMVPL